MIKAMMRAEKWRKYWEVRNYTTITNQKTERTSGRPGGLYGPFPECLLSHINIFKNKKSHIYNIYKQKGDIYELCISLYR